MGWEYDGDEDDFNNYCKSVSSVDNDEFDYSDTYKERTEGLRSFFWDKLCLSNDFKWNKCLPYQIDAVKANVPQEILDYMESTSPILFFDAKGTAVKNFAVFNQEIARKNNKIFLTRQKILNYRKKLREVKNYAEYLELSKTRKDWVNNSVPSDYIEETDIPDIVTGRIVGSLLFVNDPLVRLLSIATLYYEKQNERKGETIYTSFDLEQFVKENNFNDFDRHPDLFYDNNIFSPSKIKNGDYKFLNQFNIGLHRLEEALKLFLGHKHGVNDKTIINITVEADQVQNSIVLKSENYCMTIENKTNTLNEVGTLLRFYEIREKDLLEILSFNANPNLVPFDYNAERRGKLIELNRNNIINKRRGVSYKLLEEQGLFLINKYNIEN